MRMLTLLEVSFDFGGFGLMRGSEKSESLLRRHFRGIKEIEPIVMEEPDVVFGVWRFEPVLFSAPVHV